MLDIIGLAASTKTEYLPPIVTTNAAMENRALTIVLIYSNLHSPGTVI
jgi:hypothetical protein